MKKLLLVLCPAFCAWMASAATIIVNPWQPLYKGIDHATGQQIPTLGGERNIRVSCLRVDLTDPDIRLFTTPACTNACNGYETLAQNTSHFLEQYGLQVAINCNWYSSSVGPNDVPLGTLEDVTSLSICTGHVVSAASPDRTVALMFTTNNQPIFLPSNWPGADTTGIFTAVAGDQVLLMDGVNPQDPARFDYDPRTAIGISQDRRYLYLQTLDGRQSGWSEGDNWYNTGEWLRRFGAWDAVNVDGGGSTTMAMADCQGKGVRLNRSSFVFQYGRERIIGHNFGVYARPLPSELKNLVVTPGSTTAILTWETDFPADTQVEYGPTSGYGNATPLDPRPVHRHIATLTGLNSGSNYFFRAISTYDGTSYTQACSFATTSAIASELVFGLTNAWKFTTNSQDSIPNWKTHTFSDAAWWGPSNGAVHGESANFGVPNYPPLETVLPPGVNGGQRTCYLRTRFVFEGSTSGVTLTFSNYIDDGAVFYLNGTEIRRVRMAPAPAVISYASLASGSPCQGDAVLTCPDVFTIGGNLMTNLLVGTNVVAVEVHNLSSSPTADILFAGALSVNRPSATVPRLYITSENGVSTIYWNGQGFTLQQSTDLFVAAPWDDVPGPVTQSPFSTSNSVSTFFRLRN